MQSREIRMFCTCAPSENDASASCFEWEIDPVGLPSGCSTCAVLSRMLRCQGCERQWGVPIHAGTRPAFPGGWDLPSPWPHYKTAPDRLTLCYPGSSLVDSMWGTVKSRASFMYRYIIILIKFYHWNGVLSLRVCLFVTTHVFVLLLCSTNEGHSLISTHRGLALFTKK